MTETKKVNSAARIFWNVERCTFGFLVRYRLYKLLLREFVPYFVAGVVVVIVFMGGNTVLFNMMEQIISKKVPSEVYLRVLLLQAPTFLVMGMPMAVMFGVLMSFGRLSSDGELDAMRTSRVVAWRILLFMVIVVGLPIWYLDTKLVHEVVPRASSQSLHLWQKYLINQISGQPAANVFFQGKPGTYFFISRFDPDRGRLEGVTMYNIFDETSPYPRMMVSPYGSWREEFITLNEGRIYNVKKDGLLEFDSTFKSMKFNVEREIQEIYGNPNDPVRAGYVNPNDPGHIRRTETIQSKSLETDLIFNLSMDQSVEDLRKRIQLFKQHAVDTTALETNLNFKISIPFSCIVCILLTTPLSIGGARARAGIMKSIVLILMFMTLYYISTIVCVALGHSGSLSPWMAAWAQNIGFSAIGALLALFYMRK